jgi:nicotinamide riboside kinase
MTKIINFFGAPGTGKSTLAADLFSTMKKAKESVELITEYAKDLTWSKRKEELKNQVYVFGKQLNRIMNVYGQVEFIVTDSPILLSKIYHTTMFFPNSEFFPGVVDDVFNKFYNINFLVTSDYTFYDPNGRNQSPVESKKIGEIIEQTLLGNCKLTPSHLFTRVTRETPIEDIYKVIGKHK